MITSVTRKKNWSFATRYLQQESDMEQPQGLRTRTTPETLERLPRTITNSAEDVVVGAFQYDSCDKESKGAINDKRGAEPGADSIQQYSKCKWFRTMLFIT